VLAAELGRRSYLLRIMSDRRVRAGEPFPPLSWPRVGGGTLSLANKAQAEARDGSLRFPIAYDLSTDDVPRLGLYISPPQPGEASRPFAEPALFVVNPEGRTQVIAVTNAPFSRPDLKTILDDLRAAQDEHAPIHGTAA
jgi:hypothetical protein